MKITGIPTDSLYKWMAIAGATIFITNAGLFFAKVYEYHADISAHEAELELLSFLTQWGAAFGGCLAIFGFLLWYVKLQRFIDIEQSAKAREQQINTELAQLKLDQEKLSIQNNQNT